MRLVSVAVSLMALFAFSTIARAQGGDYILDPPEPRAGSVARFTISLTGGALTGSGTFDGRKVPGFQTGGLLNIYFGVDVDVKPGTHELSYEMPGRKEMVQGSAQIPVKAREVAGEPPADEPQLSEPDQANRERADREAKELEVIWQNASPQRLWVKAFVAPAAGPRGKAFGLRGAFIDEADRIHSGVDIDAPAGAEVYASNTGKVVLAKELLLTGNTVILDHGLGLYTLYAHLSRIDVAVGDQAERAQVLGAVGATGRATGPHLHWGANIAGARVDPATLPGMAL